MTAQHISPIPPLAGTLLSGAVVCVCRPLTAITTITGAIIHANTASNGCGGGIYTSGGALTVSQSTISANVAGSPDVGWAGGGIYANMSFTLTESAVHGNQAGGAAGVTVQGDGLIVNSTISGNTSTLGIAGGIWNTACDTCTITITNSTIADNTGIGLMNNRYATLKNVILANNSAGNCSGTMTSQGYNLDSGSTCGFISTGDLSNTSPMIGSLRDNGGPTMTHALLEGSPAIDAGDETGSPETDQRGFKRPQDGNKDGSALCDMGAYEALTKVTILTPNGAEVLPAGSQCRIEWGGPSKAAYFKASYSLDNGVTWNFITETANAHHEWLVPTTTTNKRKSLIKVTAFDASNNRLGSDKSDGPFTIEVLTITDINGGSLHRGTKLPDHLEDNRRYYSRSFATLLHL